MMSSTYTISLPEILSNEIIFEKSRYRNPGLFRVKGINGNDAYCFVLDDECWIHLSDISGYLGKITFDEILEKITDPQVQEEVLFHLDEIRKL